MSIEFLLTAFIVCVAPGVGVIYTLSSTLSGGFRAGLWAAIGCTIPPILHMLMAMAGLAALLHASALLFQAVKFAGVAYLLWMAWGILQAEGGLQFRPGDRVAARVIVRRGIMLNLLNPKLPMFFMAFLPQFIPAGSPQATAMLVELGLAFVAITGLVMAVYALAAGWLRARVVESPRAMAWLRRVFAASFAGLGAKLAFERA